MLRKVVITAALAATALTAPALANVPADLSSILPGSEVRRSISFGDEIREDVLKLNPDGTVTGNSHVSRLGLKYGANEVRQIRIVGAWSIEQGRLCIAGTGLEYKRKSCYAITKHYRGKHQYSATDTRTGDIWKMFIYTPNVLGS